MKRKRISRMALQENLTGYLFILPNLIGLSVFTLFSIVFSLFISFTNWNLVGQLNRTSFIGLENYIRIFRDDYFWASLWNNIWFLMVVPVKILLALVFAVALNQFVIGRQPLRVIYFLPHITNMAAILVVWNMLFNPEKGPINSILMSLGVKNPPMWLLDSFWAKPNIAMFDIWSSVGFYTMIYLAALQNVNKVLYEAAEIDGAGSFRKFLHITFPLISPTTFFLMILMIVGSFQQWSNIQILTEGGPGNSTHVLGYYIYSMGFNYYQMGYASAVAWMLCIIIVLFTLVQFRLQRKWVHY